MTQTETIVWHKYPDDNPNVIGGSNEMNLVHHVEGICLMWWIDDKWEWEDEKIIAWAELPKGWQDDRTPGAV
jgi:hypothetical protein